MSRLRFLVIKGGETFDMTQLTQKVQLSGRKGAAARTLTADLLDDDHGDRPRPDFDVEKGVHCLFYWDGKELFRGMVERQAQSNKKSMSITAHDNANYLANNKDTYVYTGKKASDIFLDVCKRIGLPYGQVDDTEYVIEELPKPDTTGYDAICDALSLTYKATGARFWPGSRDGKLYLVRRRDTMLQWAIESGTNLTDYSLSKSIEDSKTRIKLLSKEGTVLAQAEDTALEENIGIRQDIEKPDDDLSAAQLQELVQSMLKEKSAPKKSLSVTALGIPDVEAGVGVFILIPHLGISRSYYVEQDDHTFDLEKHTMKLTLVEAIDADTGKK